MKPIFKKHLSLILSMSLCTLLLFGCVKPAETSAVENDSKICDDVRNAIMTAYLHPETMQAWETIPYEVDKEYSLDEFVSICGSIFSTKFYDAMKGSVDCSSVDEIYAELKATGSNGEPNSENGIHVIMGDNTVTVFIPDSCNEGLGENCEGCDGICAK